MTTTTRDTKEKILTEVERKFWEEMIERIWKIRERYGIMPPWDDPLDDFAKFVNEQSNACLEYDRKIVDYEFMCAAIELGDEYVDALTAIIKQSKNPKTPPVDRRIKIEGFSRGTKECQ